MDTFLNMYKNIYFVGIGGVSMSGLAEILLDRGYKISGTDVGISDTVKHLSDLGIKINIGHKYENITGDIDLVVYTAAVKDDNEELIAARDLGIKTIKRSELLGHIMNGFQKSVAVAGTHGKTTTSSMVSEILINADFDPTVTIGGNLKSIGGNIQIGKSDYFVAEACEYCDSFLNFNPYIGIILNVDCDHLDYFKTFDNIKASFNKFAKRIHENGYLFIDKDCKSIDVVTKDLNCHIVTFSITDDSADYYAKNIVLHDCGKASFDIYFRGEMLSHVDLDIPGKHNVLNATAAFAVCYTLGASVQKIVEALGNYEGADRRFQYKGVYKTSKVIDDYAHHPTEVAATLRAAQELNRNKLWCIFQPHTYSRTKNLLSEFSEAFYGVDKVILADIYAAREKDLGEINSKILADEINKKSNNAIYIGDFKKIEEYIRENCSDNDVIITMGAGNVYTIGEDLIKLQ